MLVCIADYLRFTEVRSIQGGLMSFHFQELFLGSTVR